MSKRTKFTDPKVQALPAAPKGKRLELRDENLTGLWLRVSDGGPEGDKVVKSWSIMYEVAGRSRRYTLGTFPKLNVKAARDAAQAAFRRVADGFDPGEEKRVARESKPAIHDSVASAVEQWLGEAVGPNRRPWRPKTRQGHQQVMRANVLPHWGRRPLSSITQADVEALLDRATQSAHVWRRLHRFFTWAAKRQLIAASPMPHVDKPKFELSRDRVPTDREMAAYLRAAGQEKEPFRSVFLMLAHCAQRRSDVGDMEWSELDLSSKAWTIPGERYKNGQAHIVALSDAAVEILQAIPHLDGASHVFTTTGTTPASGYSRATERLRQRMVAELGEVPSWVLHDLRRAFADGASRLGFAPHVIDKHLGHSNVIRGVAAVYNRHQFLPERRALAEAWSRHLLALIKPEKAKSNIVELRGAAS